MVRVIILVLIIFHLFDSMLLIFGLIEYIQVVIPMLFYFGEHLGFERLDDLLELLGVLSNVRILRVARVLFSKNYLAKGLKLCRRCR